MVCLDAGFLGLILHPDAKPPIDPNTNEPIVRLKDRIEKLVEDWDVSRERVIIPTPVLSEFLVLAENGGPAYLNEISGRSNFYIHSFDQMAAVELASMELSARAGGSKRTPASETAPWQKVKFDRQIVAIAKLHSAHTLYSDDSDVRKIAEQIGIRVISCWELELPESKTPLLDDGAAPLDL